MDAVSARFGKRVRQLRVARGLTQEQLGKAAGFDSKHIGVIERGVKSSSFDAVARLAKALHVDVQELFVSENPPKAVPSRVPKPLSFQRASRRDMQRCLEEIFERLQNLQK